MVTVEKVDGGRVTIRGIGRFTIGDQAEVSADEAAYLCEERGDFDRVTEATDVEHTEVDESDDAQLEEICGYEKDDGSRCQRVAGWGRDADSGRCKDHVED